MKLVPRSYQIETAEKAYHGNTIINIKTGGGKTLIAALIIDHFINLNPEKNVLFIVPTRALVHQQSDYFRNQCNSVKSSVAEICGAEIGEYNNYTLTNRIVY